MDMITTARGDEIVVETSEDGVELTITNEDGDDTAVVMPVTTAVWLRDALTAAIDRADKADRP